MEIHKDISATIGQPPLVEIQGIARTIAPNTRILQSQAASVPASHVNEHYC